MPKWTYQHADFINAHLETTGRYSLTEDELNATSGNTFNSECPWLWTPPAEEETNND